MLALGNRLGLAEVPATVRLAAGVSGSPMVNAIGGVPTLINVFVGGIVEMTGVRFAARTVTEKVVLFDFAPVSVTHIVMAEEPDCVPALMFTVRFAPLPLTRILAGAIMLGFDDVALASKFVAGSSASSTVNP